MSETTGCTVIAYLRPKPGADARLLAIREQLMKEFRSEYTGFVSACLSKVEGVDEWRDIVVFADRAAVDASPETPAYAEWSSLVDLLRYEILEHLTQHEA